MMSESIAMHLVLQACSMIGNSWKESKRGRHMSKAQSKRSSYLCQLILCTSVMVVVMTMTAEQPLADMIALLADVNALLTGEQKHTSTSVK